MSAVLPAPMALPRSGFLLQAQVLRPQAVGFFFRHCGLLG